MVPTETQVNEAALMVSLQRSLVKAREHQRYRDHEQSRRLNLQAQAVARRVRDLLNGRDPLPWPFPVTLNLDYRKP